MAALGDAMGEAGIDAGELARVVHATTLATNLILEGKGARVGFVATDGFGDLLQMGWGIRSGADRYDLSIDQASPPVERLMTIEARERLDWRGGVLTPLDEARLAEDVRKLAARGPGAYAICLMHSYANPDHERRAAEVIRRVDPGAYVALSSQVWPQYREYERATTTVMSAAVGPLMAGYLARLETALGERGVRAPLQIMQSNGGVMPASAVAAAADPEHRVRPRRRGHRRGARRRALRRGEHHLLRHGRHHRQGRAGARRQAQRRPRLHGRRHGERGGQAARRDGLSGVDPDHRPRRSRRRRRLDRLGRSGRRAQGRAEERRRQARPRLLRPRRRGADGDRRRSRARLFQRRLFPRRQDGGVSRPRPRGDRTACRRTARARRESPRPAGSRRSSTPTWPPPCGW